MSATKRKAAPRPKSTAQHGADGHYVLRLYVAGLTTRSAAAIRAVTAICDEHLAGRYDLEVIDIYQRPTSPNARRPRPRPGGARPSPASVWTRSKPCTVTPVSGSA